MPTYLNRPSKRRRSTCSVVAKTNQAGERKRGGGECHGAGVIGGEKPTLGGPT